MKENLTFTGDDTATAAFLLSVQAAALIRRAAAGEAKAVLAREFGISRQTVYQYLQPDHS